MSSKLGGLGSCNYPLPPEFPPLLVFWNSQNRANKSR